MNKKIAFIGGSGIYQLDAIEPVASHHIQTPYGDPSDSIIETSIDGVQAFFLPRHGVGHRFLPHEVNYRANIYALKALGVEHIVSISAVGSLSDELPPASFALVDQFIDWTKGKRERSFFGDGVVAHVSTANPVESSLQNLLAKACQKVGVEHKVGGTYICIEGPQFSTRAESRFYKGLGASVIGMTNVPEAYLAKEAGMAFSTLAMVTDFDAWKDVHCSVDEIMKVMMINNKNAQKVILELANLISQSGLPSFEKENAVGLMTDLSKVSKEKRAIVETLLK